MAGGSQLTYYESMFNEIDYLRRILNTLKPSLYCPNSDLSEIVKEQETVLNTLRGEFALKMTNLEQRLKRNTVRIFGLKEAPGEDIDAVVLNFIRNKLRVSVTASDIQLCHRSGSLTGSKTRPIIVKFTNDEVRKSVWKKKKEIQDKVFIVEELCCERQEVRRIALEAFGRDQVSVKQGAVQVLMENDTEMKFYTVTQISDFLKKRDCQRFSGDTSKNE